MLTEPRSPKSRHSRDATHRKLSEGDVLNWVLLTLDPEYGYPCAPAIWLAELYRSTKPKRGAWPEKNVSTIALDAARAPHFLTARRDYPFKSSVLWRTEKGDDYLVEKGFLKQRSRRTRAHRAPDIPDSINMMSIELGLPNYPALEILKWRQILQHPKTPLTIK